MNEDTERCPGTNREGDECGHPSGWGTDNESGPCKFHGGAADNSGENNGNYKHGGYSKYLSEANFTDDEKERAEAVSRDLDDPAHRDDVLRSLISDLWVRWDRTKDPRFARELRQSLAEFGYTPEEARELHVEHSGSGGGPMQLEVTNTVIETEDVDR